jgi:hypothetical protein
MHASHSRTWRCKRRRIHVSEEEDTCTHHTVAHGDARGGGYMCLRRRRIHARITQSHMEMQITDWYGAGGLVRLCQVSFASTPFKR